MAPPPPSATGIPSPPPSLHPCTAFPPFPFSLPFRHRRTIHPSPPPLPNPQSKRRRRSGNNNRDFCGFSAVAGPVVWLHVEFPFLVGSEQQLTRREAKCWMVRGQRSISCCHCSCGTEKKVVTLYGICTLQCFVKEGKISVRLFQRGETRKSSPIKR